VEVCHIIIGIFEVHETSNVAMVVKLRDLFAWYELLDKVTAYVKDEGANLNTLIIRLTSIISCVPLQLPQPHVAICYGHAMLKCCQYATNDLKVCGGM
jgi:hypothetical protein